MPTNLVKHIAKVKHADVPAIEHKWEKAKHEAIPELRKQGITDPKRKYAYITKIFENMAHYKPAK